MFYFRGTRKPDFSKIKKIDYDEYWQERGFEIRSKLFEREEIFFNWINKGSRVFDIGCGNSRLLYELKNQKNCHVKGLDICQQVIDNLDKIDIETRKADITLDNFSIKGNYDYIIISEVLEHVAQPEDLINKLKDQADYLLISIPNSAFYRYRLGLMFKGRFFTQWVVHPSEHLRFWSHKDFLEWLEAMGLEIIKFKASNGFWFKDLWPNMFGHQICYLVKNKK